MKLRLHANQLRLRLSQSEVTSLGETGRVEEVVSFGSSQELRYTLESAEVAEPTASINGGRILVTLPKERVKHWIESNETGIEGSGTPDVLVEKDFQCLHSASELEADAFPNPLADKF